MGHPRPRHSPQQRRRPSTAIWGYRSIIAHAIPPSLLLCSAPVFHASHRGLGRVFPGPRWVALAATDVSRHIRPEGSLAKHLVPPLEAAGQSPTGSPHSPALLASPLGSPASSHGASQAALGSLWPVFSYLSPLARRHTGDALCSAPIRPHPGATSSLGSRRQVDKPEGLEGGKEGVWGWGRFSMEQRRRRGTSQHTPVPMGKASRG